MKQKQRQGKKALTPSIPNQEKQIKKETHFKIAFSKDENEQSVLHIPLESMTLTAEILNKLLRDGGVESFVINSKRKI